MKTNKLGIYVHIPFCVKKCFYCDFYSEGGENAEKKEKFTQALIREISWQGKEYGSKYETDTIFFGGGTPSLLSGEQIQRILNGIRENFKLTKDCEITMECNPKTLDAYKLGLYKKAGVNRLSIGVQSLQDDELEKLGRIHKSQDVVKTIEDIHSMGFENINLDLMFAIPGQTLKSWEETLKKAINLKPTHISFYSLEIMENTLFGTWHKEGKLEETSWQDDRLMYHRGLEILKSGGFEQYEISNSSLSGFQCKHNLKYWSMEDYLGFGPAAASFMEGVRTSNVEDTDRYIQLITEGKTACTQTHVNNVKDNMSEYMFTGLRRVCGISFEDFRERFGKEFWQVFEESKKEFRDFVKRGQAFETEANLGITQKGFDISNKIMVLFV